MYEVILQRQPKRYYARCDKPTAERLAACFGALEQDPFGPGTKALKGKLQGTWRFRVGRLRCRGVAPLFQVSMAPFFA